ncbi:MAG: tRNA preQ1(34) S-adenosylmethionine ribosyltransferase-isomerase QueA [Maricaulaceae bacterium]|jgi:S-adenosylmethionine:tRNA ribosyltransferase-isomerase
MNLDDFDFDLPEERIALRPARPRDAARLLHVGAAGALADHVMTDLPSLLRPGDVLVVNDARVIAAALQGVRPKRSAEGEDVAVSANLIERLTPDRWRVLARPGRRLRAGDVVVFGDGLEAKVAVKSDGAELDLVFNRSGDALDDAIAAIGAAPLPPYIARRRPADEADAADYQTMFAQDRAPSAVAAPTAGLHFTPKLEQALTDAGVAIERLTLDVGAGTFAPLDQSALDRGALHAEHCVLSGEVADRLNAARAEGRRVVAVGTTALRVLETAADAEHRFAPFEGETDIFIRPGYVFRGVDALVTNFHLPRSSLFMLVCAFAGIETMQRAYAHAIAAEYRFYSYGDACLLEASA